MAKHATWQQTPRRLDQGQGPPEQGGNLKKVVFVEKLVEQLAFMRVLIEHIFLKPCWISSPFSGHASLLVPDDRSPQARVRSSKSHVGVPSPQLNPPTWPGSKSFLCMLYSC